MLQKLTHEQLDLLLKKFCDAVLASPELQVREIILFGSYARGDADEESDVDIMVLTDLPRGKIAECRSFLAHTSAELGYEFDPIVAPIMQNYDFFKEWTEVHPFYRNVEKEGVRLYAA